MACSGRVTLFPPDVLKAYHEHDRTIRNGGDLTQVPIPVGFLDFAFSFNKDKSCPYRFATWRVEDGTFKRTCKGRPVPLDVLLPEGSGDRVPRRMVNTLYAQTAHQVVRERESRARAIETRQLSRAMQNVLRRGSEDAPDDRSPSPPPRRRSRRNGRSHSPVRRKASPVRVDDEDELDDDDTIQGYSSDDGDTSNKPTAGPSGTTSREGSVMNVDTDEVAATTLSVTTGSSA
ncbi:hypothetical protein BXZ70DRAFT_929382 [Cristinia sonorae]|uniref:Uncharacterized protein n=1 Tax=Cristinia sonorae TaxID=1940300 RepID=A0A8K0URW2_9AGAR|nr:hypothetical protein BXZ70DRAFT_946031 [Cristinia sonorae]KAH8102667.1 hypothetical protein BXZ70DRAFT_929382 [Cristinia sonorae]